MNFLERPMLVFWESTRACLLACQHCRAGAIEKPLPGTLSTFEAKRFITQLTGFGKPYPILIITGGDPLMRSDLGELIAYAKRLGITVALSPSVTPKLTPTSTRFFKDSGIKTISISLDGASPQTHDHIRGIQGHFEQTVAAINRLVSEGFTVQVNTTVMKQNVEELAQIASIVQSLNASIWELFFLVQVGRGKDVKPISPLEHEAVCHFLYEVSHYNFIVRAVEAPFFRRVVLERNLNRNLPQAVSSHPLYRRLHEHLIQYLGIPESLPKAQTKGTRDGSGIIFVNYKGDVYPSGFLPLPLGNITQETLSDIYLYSPALVAIRNSIFLGKCGICEYRQICGGSRARAFSATGDSLETDPACAYEPAPQEAEALIA